MNSLKSQIRQKCQAGKNMDIIYAQTLGRVSSRSFENTLDYDSPKQSPKEVHKAATYKGKGDTFGIGSPLQVLLIEDNLNLRKLKTDQTEPKKDSELYTVEILKNSERLTLKQMKNFKQKGSPRNNADIDDVMQEFLSVGLPIPNGI